MSKLLSTPNQIDCGICKKEIIILEDDHVVTKVPGFLNGIVCTKHLPGLENLKINHCIIRESGKEVIGVYY